MFPTHVFAILLLALGSLVSIVTALPTLPEDGIIENFGGNPGYSAAVEEMEHPEEGLIVVFTVFAEGYTGEDEDDDHHKPDGPKAVDALFITPVDKRLTVMKAMNGHDKTKPRLSMRQVMLGCWEWAGLQPADIKEIVGIQIENVNMHNAIAACRTKLALMQWDEYEMEEPGPRTDEDHNNSWRTMSNTIFGSSIAGVGARFEPDKKILNIRVETHIPGKSDNIYYTFSVAGGPPTTAVSRLSTSQHTATKLPT